MPERLRSHLMGARSWLAGLPTFPLALFVCNRVAYLGVSWMGLSLFPRLFLHEGGRQKFLQPYPALDGLCRWDCGWFVRIIEEGYATTLHAAVCPLFPLLGWGIEKLTGMHHLLVFLLLSNLAGLVSYYLVYKIFEELEGGAVARWGLLLFAAYPFAYYQAAGYAESSMVAATAGALLLAQRRHHILAGLVLGLGVMARQLSLLGGAGLVVVHIRQRGWNLRKLLFSPAVLGLIVPWLFIAAYALFLKRVLGEPFAFISGRSVGHGPAVWNGVVQMLQVPFRTRPEFFFYAMFVTIPTAGAIALWFRRQWLELAAIAGAMMLVNLSIGAIALGRYSATCWPAFLPLGVWLAKRPALQGPVLAMLMMFQGLFFFFFSHQYPLL